MIKDLSDKEGIVWSEISGLEEKFLLFAKIDSKISEKINDMDKQIIYLTAKSSEYEKSVDFLANWVKNLQETVWQLNAKIDSLATTKGCDYGK